MRERRGFTARAVTGEVLQHLAGWLYLAAGLLIGVVTFVGVWAYAVSSWGWLLGFAFGWLPASIIAPIVAGVWPLLAAAAVALWLHAPR